MQLKCRLKECRRIGSHFENLAVNFLALVKVSIIQRIPSILFPDRAWARLVFWINPGNSPSLFHCPMHPRRLCLHPCAFLLEEPDPPVHFISGSVLQALSEEAPAEAEAPALLWRAPAPRYNENRKQANHQTDPHTRLSLLTAATRSRRDPRKHTRRSTTCPGSHSRSIWFCLPAATPSAPRHGDVPTAHSAPRVGAPQLASQPASGTRSLRPTRRCRAHRTSIPSPCRRPPGRRSRGGARDGNHGRERASASGVGAGRSRQVLDIGKCRCQPVGVPLTERGCWLVKPLPCLVRGPMCVPTASRGGEQRNSGCHPA